MAAPARWNRTPKFGEATHFGSDTKPLQMREIRPLFTLPSALAAMIGPRQNTQGKPV